MICKKICTVFEKYHLEIFLDLYTVNNSKNKHVILKQKVLVLTLAQVPVTIINGNKQAPQ